MMTFVIHVLALLLVGIVPSLADDDSSKKLEVNDNIGAMLYLGRYGYMDPKVTNPTTGSLISVSSLKEAIREFQAFAHLNQTGELDEQTVKMMNLPRCGVKDKVGFGSNARRKKRYALQGSRWRVSELTYQITNYPLQLTPAEVDRTIRKAFDAWQEVTNLKFTEMSSTSAKLHIEIRFEKAEHGDGDAFDGPGGTLAHAFFPIYGGDVHFDDTEVWTLSSFKGTNLFQVAVHEFGHTLGLSHSDNQGALMAPFYRGYQPNFKLHTDDIKAIQSLYGKSVAQAPAPSPTNPPAPPQTPPSTLCGSPTFDTIITMVDKKTYVFKGTQYFRLTDNGVETGYPKDIATDFEGLEGNLDAAFTWTNGKSYFFKDSRYWRFTNLVRDPDYPKPITKGFKGIPNDVDAAFVWSGNGKIYFMKGKDYYRFDPSQNPPVRSTYPKPIMNWGGLPNNMDGALQYSNGYTYFFQGGNYYRFNDRAFEKDLAEPKFPRPTATWWFGCPSSPSQPIVNSLQGNQEKILPLPGVDEVFRDTAIDTGGAKLPLPQLQDNRIFSPASRTSAMREGRPSIDVISNSAILWLGKLSLWWQMVCSLGILLL